MNIPLSAYQIKTHPSLLLEDFHPIKWHGLRPQQKIEVFEQLYQQGIVIFAHKNLIQKFYSYNELEFNILLCALEMDENQYDHLSYQEGLQKIKALQVSESMKKDFRRIHKKVKIIKSLSRCCHEDDEIFQDRELLMKRIYECEKTDYKYYFERDYQKYDENLIEDLFTQKGFISNRLNSLLDSLRAIYYQQNPEKPLQDINFDEQRIGDITYQDIFIEYCRFLKTFIDKLQIHLCIDFDFLIDIVNRTFSIFSMRPITSLFESDESEKIFYSRLPLELRKIIPVFENRKNHYYGDYSRHEDKTAEKIRIENFLATSEWKYLKAKYYHKHDTALDPEMSVEAFVKDLNLSLD